MKNLGVKILVFCCMGLILGACKKQEALNADAIRGLGGDKWVGGPIDQWIMDNYTKPYNIEVKYKWDVSELDMTKTLVPVKEEKVIPVLETIKKTWIIPYENLAGADFIKMMAQKQFVLVGSPQYNPNNTITLGEAESGRKITLFVINDFDKSDKYEVKRMLHTIHHEFAHILHQHIAFSSNYQKITPDGYDATWFNYSNSEARALGFITAYARSNKDDDFVEMIATMLVEGKAGFAATLNSTTANGRALLLQKQAMVTSYMKEAYGIEIGDLQDATESAIDAL